MAKLSKKERNSLPDSVFAGPGRSYPVPDKSHAAFAIHVASIQHAKGNLSAAQYRAIHAKASRVLHMKDGGVVMARGKSNISKQFAQKAAMRLADGGLIANRMANMEQIAGAAPTPAPAPVPTPAPSLATPPAQPMSAEEMAIRTKYGMAGGAPQPTLMDKVKNVFKFADGGYIPPGTDVMPRMTQAQIARQAGFPLAGQAPVAPPPTTTPTPIVDGHMVRQDPNRMQVRTITSNMSGVRAKDGGEISLRGAIRHGELRYGAGNVEGPGGPRDDKVPAMLSNGEYVLPADVVKHIGKDNLDKLVDEHHKYSGGDHDGDEPSLRHYADGGAASPIDLESPQPRVVPGTPSPEAQAYEAARGNVQQGGGTMRPATLSPSAPAPAPSLSRAGRFFRGAAPLGVAAGLADTYNEGEEGIQQHADRLGLDMATPTGAIAAHATRALQNIGNALTFGVADRVGNAASGSDIGNFDHSPMYETTERPPVSSLRTNPTAPAPARTPATIDGATGQVDPGPSLNVTRNGNNVSITDDGDPTGARGRAADQAAIRARYLDAKARAQDPRMDPANIAAEHAAIAAKYAPAESLTPHTIGGAVGTLLDQRRGDKYAMMNAGLGQRERESLRSAGVALSGQASTAASARNAARIAQMNADRQHAFEVAKAFGTDGTGTGGEQGRAEQQARDTATKNVHEQLASMIPPIIGADNKPAPDTATIARYTAGLNDTVGNLIKNGEQYLAKNPGDTQVAAKLARLRRDGPGALGPDDIRRHVAGMQTADIGQQQHSNLNPFKGNAPQTQAPVVSLRYKPGNISGDYEATYGDGSKGTIPARAIDKSSDAVFGMGGQRRSDSDILKTPSLRNQ
jgi:hypothetical protein